MFNNTLTFKWGKKNVKALYVLFFVVCSFISNLVTGQGRNGTPDKGTTFTAQLINIEAAVHEVFRYSTTLHNGSVQPRIFELTAGIPDGWSVIFRARGYQLTSINMDGNKDESISIEIHPAYNAKPTKYKIPITAVASGDSVRLDLEAVVKGAYGIELTTPTGLLSDKITEGKKSEVHLVVKNTGTLSLTNISLSAQTPSKWDATFNPSKIEGLEPGKTVDVIATLNVPDKTIAGDYLTTFSAKNETSNAQAIFRMTVRTSMLSGWIGIMVIFGAIGLVYFLIRKYGRR